MIFYDERCLWYAETEELARRLENKSARDIQEIFDDHDVIRLRACDRPDTSMLGRLLLPVVALCLIITMPIKWVITGSSHFDSFARKHKWLKKITDYVGIKG